MNKNGKNIKCKTCNKLFYISESRFEIKKYCSKECAKKDNYGFKPRNKKCVICGNDFIIDNQLRLQDKTCSFECHNKLNKQLQIIRNKKEINRICKICGKEFIGKKWYIGKNICKECRFKKLSKDRKGKNNPAYTFGLRINANYSGKHLRACKKYRKAFLEKYGYLFCEYCKINQALKFEVHHIVWASEAPKHPQLHNPKNLILLCIKCHNQFHKHKEMRLKLVEERGLKELFSKGSKVPVRLFTKTNAKEKLDTRI